eukprot:scaffold68568_cov27-Prasinocladus_malaysianus.AAC.1
MAFYHHYPQCPSPMRARVRSAISSSGWDDGVIPGRSTLSTASSAWRRPVGLPQPPGRHPAAGSAPCSHRRRTQRRPVKRNKPHASLKLKKRGTLAMHAIKGVDMRFSEIICH